jgi:hypothetical protein
MAPAREVLALSFVWRMLKTAAMTAYGAIRCCMCRSTYQEQRKTPNSVASIFKDSVGHVVATLDWA